MAVLPSGALRTLGERVQGIAVASAAFRKALAKLVTTGGQPQEAERRTR